MIAGIDFSAIDPSLALNACHICFDKGLVIELAGREDCVLKILPPLTIDEKSLSDGLEIVKNSVSSVLK